MKEILEKLKIVLKNLEIAHGPILFFAFFLREDAVASRWDLLISADWLKQGHLESYTAIDKVLWQLLDENEWMQIGRTVILDTTDPAMEFLQDFCTIPYGSYFELLNCVPLSDFFGFDIRRAVIFRCKNQTSFVSPYLRVCL